MTRFVKVSENCNRLIPNLASSVNFFKNKFNNFFDSLRLGDGVSNADNLPPLTAKEKEC